MATSATSCKMFAKSAAKHWTKKQKKQFLKKCKEGSVERFGDKANKACECGLEKAQEKYPNAEDALALSAAKILKIVLDCR